MTIEVSWWVVPLIITIIAFVWARVKSPNVERGNTYFAGVGEMLIAMLYFGMAAIASLIAWLIWALLN